MDGDKDAIVSKKMEKMTMSKKQREANAVPEMVEDYQLNKVEKKSKTDKRKVKNYTDESGDKDAKKGVTDGKYEKTEKKKAKAGSETNNAEKHEKDFAEVVDNLNGKNKKKKIDKRKPKTGPQTNATEMGEDMEKKESLEQVGDDQSNNIIYYPKKQEMCLEVDDGTIPKNGLEQKERKKKRLKKEKRNNEDVGDSVSIPTEIEEHGFSQKARSADIHNGEEQTEKKKQKNKVRRSEDEGGDTLKDKCAAEEVGRKALNSDTNVIDRTEKKKKKKKTVREKADSSGKGEFTGVVEKISKSDIDVSNKVNKKRKRENNKGKDHKDGKITTHSTRKRSKGSETEGHEMSNDHDSNGVESNAKDSKLKNKKKVHFSENDEVFPLEGGVIQGKRFSPKEDEMVKQAVFEYIKVHDLGDEGLAMVLHCKSHPKVKNCWKEIGLALPYRPYKSVYDRAHSLFERDQTRSWSSEELEIVRKYHAEHGPKWKQLADAMGKHRRHIKDAWRRTKLPDRKKGHWSQDEYQALFDLVNVDLKAKVNEEKKSKHGMLKDNISWMAISDTLATRNNYSCCKKWYDQLTSSMVKEGEWADTDDYHLIDALYTLDACCIEDVDWDSLLGHRSGDLCLKRWRQMANHIGEHGKKSFVEQVEILSKRYCSELLEAREIWDNKPRVP